MHTFRSLLSCLNIRLPFSDWSFTVAPKWTPEPGLFFVRRVTPDCYTLRLGRHSDLYVQRVPHAPLLWFDMA